MTLMNQMHDIVQAIPVMDATSNHYSCWIDVSMANHTTLILQVGRHNNEIDFSIRKGIKKDIIGNKENFRGYSPVPLQIARYWESRNTDATASTGFTLKGRPSVDSTISSTLSSIAAGKGYRDMQVRGETYIVEIDNRTLGTASDGDAYNAIQVRASSTRRGELNLCSVLAILSDLKYAGRTGYKPSARLVTRDW